MCAYEDVPWFSLRSCYHRLCFTPSVRLFILCEIAAAQGRPPVLCHENLHRLSRYPADLQCPGQEGQGCMDPDSDQDEEQWCSGGPGYHPDGGELSLRPCTGLTADLQIGFTPGKSIIDKDVTCTTGWLQRHPADLLPNDILVCKMHQASS